MASDYWERDRRPTLTCSRCGDEHASGFRGDPAKALCPSCKYGCRLCGSKPMTDHNFGCLMTGEAPDGA